jgi:ketosteroid isomerase-like protein
MVSRRLAAALTSLLLAASVHAQQPDNAALARQVADVERAFARSMADRDHAAFTSFLTEQTVFWLPDATRGKAAVAAFWKRFYEGKQAPFSWEPDDVQVLADGTLAFSTGPVRNPEGKVTSRFMSVWRQEAPGVWRIIFDRGSPLSPADKKKYGVE